MNKIVSLIIVLILLALIIWPVRVAIYAQHTVAPPFQALKLVTWNAHDYDLVYIVAFSSEQQRDGPLVVYRASAADAATSVPVIALQRSSLPLTPELFPSPNGQFLALLSPFHIGYDTNLNGAALRLLSTNGNNPAPARVLVPSGVAAGDQIIWSAESLALYYHSGVAPSSTPGRGFVDTGTHKFSRSHDRQPLPGGGYDEIHRVDLAGHDVTLLRWQKDDGSLRLLGLDRSGALVLTLARPGEPVALLRLDTQIKNTPSCGVICSGGRADQAALGGRAGLDPPLLVITTLPPDILPGNVLRVGSDGASVECERVLNWHPLRYTLIHIAFTGQFVSHVAPLFDTGQFGHALTPLSRSADGDVLVMSQVMSVRSDLAAQGIAGVPAQESLLLADVRTGATQRLVLPFGGQIVQAFWTAHIPIGQLHIVPQDVLAELMAPHKRLNGGPMQNASVFQQDEWMLEGHANRLFDAPILPKMCYAFCPQGLTGAPHVSAAILHGVAYTETNWHQFNSGDYRVNGEPIGSPVESFDGGWGEYQQTWGMPPQCNSNNTCRSDAFKIEHDQSYNIGVGVQSLINAWNGSAGVVSNSDPNDPFKANHWFFAVWAYNGAYGNNPNDVPSSQYGQWYPGAPFRTIYEEYVWYFAAHPQFFSNRWTDNYLPSLGPALLPPQADFISTSDSFVACITCTIPDWTAGTYDRDWVAAGAPDSQVAGYFKSTYAQLGGEDVLGLPRDNGGGAATHRWGNGWVQDFGSGSDLPGALMLADGTTTPYWVHGGVWTQYLLVDRGVRGCHGYPTSQLSPYIDPNLGTDTYLRQNFSAGSIVWDATTNTVAADVCS